MHHIHSKFTTNPFPYFFSTFILFFVLFTTMAYAGFLDDAVNTIKEAGEHYGTGQKTRLNAASSLSETEMVTGFKDALSVGAKRAVKAASSPGGFLNNPSIRIPLPDKLQQAATILQAIGMGNQVQALEETMNRAAEKACARALPIFGEAVKAMTFENAKKLLHEGDRAITQYFKEKTWDKLYSSFLPIVHETLQQVGVIQKYQAIVSRPAIQQMVTNTDFDLNHYVTNRALAGLFTLLGEEEKRIRANPLARTTEMLKRVFSTNNN